jgi:hypothetical protein
VRHKSILTIILHHRSVIGQGERIGLDRQAIENRTATWFWFATKGNRKPDPQVIDSQEPIETNASTSRCRSGSMPGVDLDPPGQ